MRVRTLTDTVGAEIEGVRLDRLDDATFDGIRAALDSHGGVLFRDQSLEPADLVAFSRRFGELDHAPVMEKGRTAVEGWPEIYIVSNVLDAEGKPIGSLGAGEAVWHTDMSYLENPPDFSMLYAIEVPASGGDTWLSSMAAAHDDLPGELREQIADLSIKHDGTFNSGGYLRQGVREDSNPATSVGQPHPVVCAHPRTGRPVLYLGRRRNAYVMGLELEASETLLDRLWEHATRPELAYAHRWRPGDLLLWDNRATMHRRDPFDPEARRVMQRTQVRGHGAPRPVAET